MALFPCDVDLHRYPGPQQTMYPALVRYSGVSRRKLRLCPGHFETYAEQLLLNAEDATSATDGQALNACFVCHQSTGDEHCQLFVTVYALGLERQDFWAPLHEDCVSSARANWRLPPSIDS